MGSAEVHVSVHWLLSVRSVLIKYGFGICELFCLYIDHGSWHFWELVEHSKELNNVISPG